MKIVVVAGTSAIAEHCCRLWVARQPVDLTLVVRDVPKAEKIAADLRVRSPQSTVSIVKGDFLDPAAIGALVSDVTASGPVDIALIAQGWLADQQKSENDLAYCRESLEINALSPVLFAESFARYFRAAGRGTLAIIGSVAGDRGRKANYTYGAAKGFLARYAEGMEHRLAGTGVKVVLIKPGPTESPMTSDIQAEGRRVASTEDVARTIVKGIERGSPVIYAPPIWQAIMLVVRHIPRFIFNKLSI
ncbi:MAG TPA: SDR family NAD(P)-dependent oxidoreductase [Reyranella sp.]|nr:SDR family NAD(P)-dependent oxidoreductase [Reyranella sp.]